jgi:hypothetical protein
LAGELNDPEGFKKKRAQKKETSITYLE